MFCVYFIVHAFGISVVASVINIDIISYLVGKNVIHRFRPCWVYPVGYLAVPLSWKCERRVCECGPNVVRTCRW